MRKIMEKYNNAFGYVKGYLVLCGLVGVGAMIFGIVDLITNGTQSDIWSVSIICGLIITLLAVAIVFFTYKKCPEGKKNIVALTINMMIVGIGAAFVLAFWMAKLMLSIIGINIGGKQADTTQFANSYRRDNDGQYCYLWSTSGTLANLKDESGNLIEVRLHNDDGLVIDNSGNLYRPE